MKSRLFWVMGFGLLLGAGRSEGQSITTVALSGQAADGAPAGVIYAGFSLKPAITNSGTIAFVGDLSGAGIGGDNNRAIWVGLPGSLKRLAQTGATAPGTGGSFTDFPVTPAVNDAGQVGFVAQLSTGSGVFRSSAAGTQAIAWTGGAADSFYTFDRFPAFATMNASGVVAFNASTTFFGLFPSAGIYGGTPGNLTTIASATDNAPGGSGIYLGFLAPSINAGGRTTFSALTSSDGANQDGDGIWSGPLASVSPVAVEGATAPGTGTTYAGGRIDVSSGQVERLGFLGGSLNASGDLAFLGLINSPSNDRGVWVKKGNTVSLVARVGSPAPGFEAGAVFSDFDALRPAQPVPHDPVLNNNGKIAMFATVHSGGTNGANNEGIWIGDEHGLSLLERTARHAPGTASAVFSHFQYSSLNSAGETAFLAEVSGAGIASGTTGLWGTDIAGHTMLLALEGNSLTVAPNDQRQIAQILGYFGNNNQDGAPEGLNDKGQVAFTALFNDGSSGVFVGTIPYPGDANGDQKVDRSDLSILLSHMGQEALQLPGDFNYDGGVDFRDFQLFEKYFGTGRDGALGAAASIQAVPEPGMISAVAGLGVMLFSRRLRRNRACSMCWM